MDTGKTVATNVVRVVVGAAARRGVGAAELLGAVGVDPAVLEHPEGRVATEAASALWLEAVRRTRDPAFGLHAAESLEEGALGVIEHLARSSATLGDAYAQIGRYYRLLHDAVTFELETRRGVACLYQVLSHPAEPPPPCTEFALASLLMLGGQMTRLEFRPLAVAFQHPRPTSTAEYQRIFRTRVRFGARRTELRLDPALLSRPLVGANPTLSALLERYAAELVARLPSGTSLAERVRLCLTERLRGGDPSAAGVAAKLRMSTRQLQRRLASEGTTFRDLRQSLRRSLAMGYLEDEQRSPTEVAFLLGFADPSSFHRAFKLWTGKTPAACRRS